MLRDEECRIINRIAADDVHGRRRFGCRLRGFRIAYLICGDGVELVCVPRLSGEYGGCVKGGKKFGVSCAVVRYENFVEVDAAALIRARPVDDKTVWRGRGEGLH